MNQIDWTNPEAQVSTHFTVKDMLNLPQWNRLANEDDGLDHTIKENLINLCAHMEGIRQFFGNKPILVHCTYRPDKYNQLVGGATKSAHLDGLAMDFHFVEYGGNNGCDWVREKLIPKLDEFGIRLEDISDLEHRAWCHVDLKNPNPNRYFKP